VLGLAEPPAHLRAGVDRVAGQEVEQDAGGPGRLHDVQQVGGVLQHGGLGLRHPLLDLLAALDVELGAARAEHEQRRDRDGAGLLGAELPRLVRRSLHPEVRVGVTKGLVERAGHVARHDRPLLRAAKEQVLGHLPVAHAVALARRPDEVDHALRAGHRQQRRLQQHQGVHQLGSVRRQLQRDRAAVRMADDVRSGDVEVLEQGTRVGGLVDNGDRPPHRRAAEEAAPVVADEAVALGQLLPGDERQKGPGDMAAVDEQNGLTRAAHLVLELDTVDPCGLHLRRL